MTKDSRLFERAADSRGSAAFLDEERESFTQAFAYDHFQWPAFKVFGTARPTVMEFRTPVERAAEARGLEGDDQAAPYTTTNSPLAVYKTGYVVPVEPDAAVTPQTNLSGPVVGIDDFRNDARFDGIDGSGQAVVIIDGGIDLDDPFFGPDADGNGISDRIVYQYDFADNDGNASDVDGHGSNVASIAASSDATYTGMAPGADIIALKVFSDFSEVGSFGDIEASLQWVINNAAAYNIVSVNMSLSDGGNYNAPIGLYGIAEELAELASIGVIVVSSSGNDFYEFNSVQGVAYPSADPNSLSVGAVYDGNSGGWNYLAPDGSVGAIAYTTGADRITPFSQRDDELTDILAPGADIIGAGAGAGLVSMHGTSQAAPHITGIIALAQQLAVEVLGRKLTYDEFTDLLTSSADIVIDGDDEHDNVANTGLAFPRVNVAKLGEAILDMAEPNSFSISALSAVKAEGDGGSTAFTFTVTRSGYSGEAASVGYSVSGGTASGADFTGNLFPAGTVSFAAGQTSKTLTILVKGDVLLEGNESFTVSLSNPSGDGTIGTGSANGLIVNDDAAPPSSSFAIAAADAVKLEGDSGSTAFTFTVTRSGDTGQAGTVSYSVGGGAVDGTDFAGGTLPAGTLGFAAGEISKTVTVTVRGDTDAEADEAFTVTLANPSANATIAVATAGGIIANDDAGPGEGVVLLQADFDAAGDTEGFQYRDGLFGGTFFQRYASGDWEDQALRVRLGGVNNNIGRDLSGGWQTDFVVGEAGEVALSFRYDLSIGADYDDGEYSQVLVSIDGGAPILIDRLDGDGNDGPQQTTGMKSVTLALGALSAGSHSLEIGAYNNQKSWRNEETELLVDDVVVTGPGEPPPPPPSGFAIAALDTVRAEGDAGETLFTFTVTRSGDASTAAAVDYAVSGVAGASDFVGGLPSGTLVFLTGETSKTLTVTVAGDTAVEADENFTVTLSNPSEGAEIETASAVGTILNDDAATPASSYAIAALDAVKDEGDVGSTAFTFTITRSGDTSAAGAVDYAVTGAANGTDFAGGVLPAGTVSFAAGEASKTLTLNVAGDTTVEPDESFTVTLTSAGGAEIVTASADGTILNDDAAAPATFFAISPENAVRAEGHSLASHFTFLVSRSGDTSAAGSVDYAVTSAAADASDFFYEGVFPSGTLNFAAGQSSQTLLVMIHGDKAVEDDEDFTVTLRNPSVGSAIATASADGTILNDDAPPPATSFTIAPLDSEKAEGDDGGTVFTFTVTREGDLSAAGSVGYRTTGGPSPWANALDFLGDTAPKGVLEFSAGEASRILSVVVSGDTEFEGDESFFIHLENPSPGSEITTSSASGVILNDDTTATTIAIAAADAVKPEGDSDTTPFTFTVTRSGDTAGVDMVDYAVTGSQVDTHDFPGSLLPRGTLTFDVGETTKTITIDVVGDHGVEIDETFTVLLLNSVGGAVITTDRVQGTILNDDTTPTVANFNLLEEDSVKSEGDAGTTAFTFTIVRNGDTSVAGSVEYAVSAVSADASDFPDGVLPSGIVHFAVGETSKTLSIAVSGDQAFEGDEVFSVALFNASAGHTIGSTAAPGVILNDDPPPPATFLAIAADDAVKAEGDAGSTAFTFTVTRSGDSSSAGSVDYSVTGAADGLDFVGGLLPGGTLSFAAGETSKTITVNVAGDTAFEADEGFAVTLSNVSAGAAITTASAQGTILNDDDAGPSTFSIAARYTSRVEGNDGSNTPFAFEITRTSDTAEAGSVYFEVTSSQADGSDFTNGVLHSGWINFPAGENFNLVTLGIWVVGDNIAEADETFTVTLSDPSAGFEISTASASATILNDDGALPAYFAIAAEDAVKAEGDAGATDYAFTVTRSGDTSAAGSVDWTVSGGDSDAADFGGSLPGGTVSFAAGETARTVTVQASGDTDFEADEDFTVTLSNPSAGGSITAGSAQGSILNDDLAPPDSFLAITAADAVKAEGDAGTTAFTFTVMRSGDTSAAGTVDYAVTGAADGSDFAGGLLPSGTLSFAAGETSKTLTVDVAGDTAFEVDEDFTVTLANASPGSAITIASAAGTIENDDPAPPATFIAIAADNAVQAEGDAGGTAFTFTVTRSGDSSAAGSVDYAVTGTADGSDFLGGTLPGGTVSFAAGETSKVLTLEVAGDTAFEANEGFTVTLANASPGSAITTANAAGTIENDDPAPPATFIAIAADNAVQAEGDAGSTAFTFTVTRSGDSSTAGSVDYAVAGAVDGDDFVGGMLPSGTVSFAAGETSKVLTLEVAGDTAFEANEGLTVTLSNASAGSAITTASAAGTIENDDPAPPATFLAIAADEAVKEEGQINETFLTFTVTRSGDTSLASTVDYAVSGEVDGADFVGGMLPDGALSFAAGETSKTLSFNVAGDGDEEPDESFTVTLSNASAESAISTGSATGTILNDDGPSEPPVDSLLSIEAVDAVKSEGDDGTTLFTFIVSRPGTIIGDASVDYTVTGSGGDPADASDFAGGVLPSGTVTIQGEGASSATIVIAVAGDSDIEGDEGFTVTLSNPSAGATIVTASAEGIILNDDAEDPTPGEGVVILAADFDGPGDTEGFVYSDGVFTSLSFQAYAAGSWDDQALTIDLGGMNNRIGRDIAGAWETDFALTEEMEVTLRFDYDMLISEDYDSGEYSQLLVSIDGGSAILIEELIDGGPLTASGSVTLDLGSLGAGSHSLAIGGCNNQKSWSNEFTEISIDDVLMTGNPTADGAAAVVGGSFTQGDDLQPLSNLTSQETELLATAGF